MATAWTTSSDSRMIECSPLWRRTVIWVSVSSAIDFWPNHVDVPTAAATTSEVARISLTEIGIPARL